MNASPSSSPDVDQAASLDALADAFDRARPSYPADAARWLLEGLEPVGERLRVVDIAAATGRLSEALAGAPDGAGCDVVGVDRSAALLARYAVRVPGALAVTADLDHLPLRNRAADLVVAGGPPERLDPTSVLAEGARVLRPGGCLVLTWMSRDPRIPWVRRLDELLGATERQAHDVSGRGAAVERAIDEAGVFETVERSTYRSWQPMSRALLGDLVRVETVTEGSQVERNRMLRAADELYDGYGRGADGMLMPYVTTVLRTAVLPWAATDEPEPQEATSFDDDALLIDFR